MVGGRYEKSIEKKTATRVKRRIWKISGYFFVMVLLISLVSGFLVADNSIMDAYQKGFDQYNVEYGNLSTKNAIASKDRKAIEKENKLILYEQNYYELKESKKNATIRIYGMRKKVNTLCLMSGTYPKKDNEIALVVFMQKITIIRTTTRFGSQERTIRSPVWLHCLTIVVFSRTMRI